MPRIIRPQGCGHAKFEQLALFDARPLVVERTPEEEVDIRSGASEREFEQLTPFDVRPVVVEHIPEEAVVAPTSKAGEQDLEQFDFERHPLDETIAAANELARAGRFGDASAEWRHVARTASRQNGADIAARASLSAAHCACEENDVEAALADAEAAWDAATAASDRALRAEAAELRGELLCRTRNFDDAKRWLREALAGFEALNSPVDRARVLMTLGAVLYSNREYESSLEVFAEAQDIFRSEGRGLDASRCDDRSADALIELVRLPEALSRLHAAARVAEATDDKARIAFAQYRLGWTSVIAGLGEESMRYLERARDLYAELGNLVATASCDEKAARVLSDMGDHDRAVGLFERSIAVFEAFGEMESARIAESNLADVFSGLSRYEDAVARRVALLERLPQGADHARAGVAVRLAEDLLGLGDALRALAVLDEVRAYYESNESLGAGQYQVTLARALLAADRVSSARREADSLICSIDRTTLPEVQAKAFEVVAECERRTGSRGAADRFLGQAVALYLAIDEHDKATELSRALLPERRPAVNTGPESPLTYRAGYI